MEFDVAISRRAHRNIAQLPERYALSVLRFVAEVLPKNPYRVGKELDDPLLGIRSARVDAYRILYEIDDDLRLVTVVKVGHRAIVYRP